MSIPRFQLTKHRTVQCYRKTPGTYVNGDYVEGYEVPFSIEANVQPMKMKEQLMLKESERERDWITVYSSGELKGIEVGDDGYLGDIVEWEGYRYRVMKVKHYSMQILDHWQASCAKLEVTLKSSYPESE